MGQELLISILNAIKAVFNWTVSVFHTSSLLYFVIAIVLILAIMRTLVMPAISSFRLSDTARYRVNSRSNDNNSE